MIETQVLMIISDFQIFFSRNHSLEGGFTFQMRGEGKGVDFSLGGQGLHFKMGGCCMGASVLMRKVFKKRS